MKLSNQRTQEDLDKDKVNLEIKEAIAKGEADDIEQLSVLQSFVIGCLMRIPSKSLILGCAKVALELRNKDFLEGN